MAMAVLHDLEEEGGGEGGLEAALVKAMLLPGKKGGRERPFPTVDPYVSASSSGGLFYVSEAGKEVKRGFWHAFLRYLGRERVQAREGEFNFSPDYCFDPCGQV